MCLYDVRRAKASGYESSGSGSVVSPTPVKLVGGNATRTRFIFTMRSPAAVSGNEQIIVRAGGSAGPVVGSATIYNMTTALTLEGVGAAVMSELWAENPNGVALTYHYTEVEVNVEDDEV